ncbi:hypothetical protein HDF24_11715 [Mucilaginibacter sp. X4EP1]|uniref:hypothetical protein n=1 Tax=Mucilaginibacter sp. X4EP1 TaxID=2723092 RepID=UPI00216A3C96|nr:hypothetical protein [Mucilaginibacter sp. X4EP1]MCS3812925.1 hypothetical protein [Mucilaginibacter sp. X4EP1]
MKTKAITLFILVATLLGCSKDKSSITLSGPSNSCPVNSSCSYIYYDNANFNNTASVQAGPNRVFTYVVVNSQICNLSTSVYFKTALSNNDFEINDQQIASGQVVAYGEVCTCCDLLANTKVIGGDIKGKKTGTNTWLINATVIIGNSSGTPIDTVAVNQYFNLTTMNAVAL